MVYYRLPDTTVNNNHPVSELDMDTLTYKKGAADEDEDL